MYSTRSNNLGKEKEQEENKRDKRSKLKKMREKIMKLKSNLQPNIQEDMKKKGEYNFKKREKRHILITLGLKTGINYRHKDFKNQQ